MLEGIGHGKQEDVHEDQSFTAFAAISQARINCGKAIIVGAIVPQETTQMPQQPNCPFLPMLFRRSRIMHHSDYDPRSLLLSVVDALGSFHEIRGLSVRNIDEGLRITVGKWKPRTLHLHHDAVAAPNSMVHVLHMEIDFFYFAGRERLRLLETMAKLSPERLAAHQLLISTHIERWGRHV